MKSVNIHLIQFGLLALLTFYKYQRLQAQNMTLQQCIQTALSNNKSLEISRNNLNLNQFRVQEAKSNLSPKATVSSDYKLFTNLPYQLLPLSAFNGPEGQYKEAQFGVPHNLGINVQLAMPLYNPQIKAGIKGSAIVASTSMLQVEKVEEQIIFEVTNLYYNAQLLQQQSFFLDSNLLNFNRLIATLQLLQSQGLAKGTDIDKVKLQQFQLQSQRIQLNGKLEQVFNGLNFLMGRDLGMDLSVSTDIEEKNAGNYSVSEPLEVRLIKTHALFLANELDILKKGRLPNVSIVANYGTTGFGYFKQPDPFFKMFPVGFIAVQASYPIWNRASRFKIAQKEVEINSNWLQLEQVQTQNDLQVANAIVQKNTARASLPAAQQQIAWANSVYQQTLMQQEYGTASITDVLLADNTLREAQTHYLNVLIEFLRADLELKKAASLLKK